MLGAAFAGLSCLATDADAVTVYAPAVFTESDDFSNISGAPTDLSSTFGNFLNGDGIQGFTGAGDWTDAIKVNVSPSTQAAVNFRASSSVSNPFFGINVFNSAGTFIGGGYLDTMPLTDTYYEGTLSFVTPADGLVIFATNHEAGGATINYSIGAVPEPSAALLGLAGVAALALRRRRDGK